MKTIKMDYAEYQQMVKQISELEKSNKTFIELCRNQGAVVTYDQVYSLHTWQSGVRERGVVIPRIESTDVGFKELKEKYEDLVVQVQNAIDDAYKDGFAEGVREEKSAVGKRIIKKRKWYQIF
jgi:hypothetical protein